MDFTSKEIVLALLGSGGFIGGLIAAFVFITGRLDKRRERAKEQFTDEVRGSTDMKRFELDAGNTVHAQLWEIIHDQKTSIKELETELSDMEAKAVLQRPVLLKVYANLRAMRKEIESLNLMILNEEETNVFMRRFQTVKQLLDDTEGMLP